MPSSFDNTKQIMFQITLGTGTFGSSGANTITLQGFRASVEIDHGGGQMFGTLHANIYGVSQSDMNAVTVLQRQALQQSFLPNTISVYAIDGAQKTLVFAGNIVNAWGNYNSQPDVFLQIMAQAAYVNKLKPVAPSSFNGPTDVATVMKQLATTMGYQFENSATPPVTVQLSNPCLVGTAIDQAQDLAEAAGIWFGIDGSTLWITPAWGSRKTTNIPEISPQTGMKGYPVFDGQGYVYFETLFNPAILFLGQIKLVSSIPRANGQWTVVGVAHKLESQKPGGSWHSTVRVFSNGVVPIS